MEANELLTEKRYCEIQKELSEIKLLLTEILAYQQANSKDSTLDVNELAELLNLDKNIIYAKCGNGEIPYFRVGNRYKFKRSEIMTWLKNQSGDRSVDLDDYVNRYLQKKVLRT